MAFPPSIVFAGMFFAEKRKTDWKRTADQRIKSGTMGDIVTEWLAGGFCSLPLVTASFGVVLIAALTALAVCCPSDEEQD